MTLKGFLAGENMKKVCMYLTQGAIKALVMLKYDIYLILFNPFS